MVPSEAEARLRTYVRISHCALGGCKTVDLLLPRGVRNWYTHRLRTVWRERAWRFESSQPHCEGPDASSGDSRRGTSPSHEQGHNNCEFSRQVGVSRSHGPGLGSREGPPSFEQNNAGYGRPNDSSCLSALRSRGTRLRAVSTSYAHLLGMYLGDGHISKDRRGVFRLRISLDQKYPLIVEECAAAMQGHGPGTRSTCPHASNYYVEVHAYSKSWPCLFPQHGPGQKARTKDILAGWQKELAARMPDLLLRGLLHSDGCRFMNTGSYGWDCSHATSSPMSPRHQEIFCDACDSLGLRWTARFRRSGGGSIYVSRKDDVARLDEFVGPKR